MLAVSKSQDVGILGLNKDQYEVKFSEKCRLESNKKKGYSTPTALDWYFPSDKLLVCYAESGNCLIWDLEKQTKGDYLKPRIEESEYISSFHQPNM